MHQEQGVIEDLECSHLQDTLGLYKYVHHRSAPQIACLEAFTHKCLRRDALQEAGQSEGAQDWLSASLQTNNGTDHLYSLLQQYVQKPAFLQKLTTARTTATTAGAVEPSVGRHSDTSSASEFVHLQANVTQATFWDPAPGGSADEVCSNPGLHPGQMNIGCTANRI